MDEWMDGSDIELVNRDKKLDSPSRFVMISDGDENFRQPPVLKRCRGFVARIY